MSTRWTRAKAKRTINRLLSRTREDLKVHGLNRERLPSWVNAANVRYGIIRNTLFLVIEDSTYTIDKYTDIGNVACDTAVLFSLPHLSPHYVWHQVPEGVTQVTITTYGEGNPPLFEITPDTAFYNIPLLEKHGPFILFELCFQLTDPVNRDNVISLRMAPVAIYLSYADYLNQDDTINFLTNRLIGELQKINGAGYIIPVGEMIILVWFRPDTFSGGAGLLGTTGVRAHFSLK